MTTTITELRADYDCEELRLYASHSQFYIQDSNPTGDTGDPSFWTQQACDDKLAIADGILGIGTGSYDFVRVFVKHYQKKPPRELKSWDHVTEAGLDISSGLLLVSGCLSVSGVFFSLKPGHYRVRCNHANLAQANSPDEADEASDWYFVQFWPGKRQPPVVVKRWSEGV